jgi:hypothetical protein
MGQPDPSRISGTRGRRIASLICTLLLLAWACPDLLAQEAEEHELKAAFLYNFAKFIRWPAPQPSSFPPQLQICLMAAPTIAGSLREQTRGKVLDSRAVVIRELSAPAEMGSCQILFLGASGRKAQEFLKYALKLPIVTVGEDEQFLGHGGIIRLYSQDAKLGFAINADAASRAGVTINSALLGLARIVRDKP